MADKSPAEIAGLKIAQTFNTLLPNQYLTSDRVADIINEALTEERAQHSKTEREHSQMAAYIRSRGFSAALFDFELESLETGKCFVNWLIVSAKRYNSVKNAGGEHDG